jgi:hypothetical protein
LQASHLSEIQTPGVAKTLFQRRAHLNLHYCSFANVETTHCGGSGGISLFF